MTIPGQGSPPPQEDPQYAQGMTHLQMGEWDAAIRCFEDLAQRYPGDPGVERILGDARNKAKYQSETRVRPRRGIFPWRAFIVRGLILILVGAVVYAGIQVITGPVQAALAARRMQQEIAIRVERGYGLLDAENFEQARDEFEQALRIDAVNEQAIEGLTLAEIQQAKWVLYQSALDLRAQGDLEAARDLFAQLQRMDAIYRDVRQQIREIQSLIGQRETYERAEAAFIAGDCEAAVAGYEQLQQMNVSYERQAIENHLVECYVALGLKLLQTSPPQPSQMPTALEFFAEAAALRPTHSQAVREKRLAGFYLDGEHQFYEGDPELAAQRLQAVYDQEPDYLGGVVQGLLHEAYVRSGDIYNDANQCPVAYERYRRACEEVPVGDVTLACTRQKEMANCITPTATPTPTPTATPTPAPTRTPGPTATATPPPPLWQFINQIVFRSDNPEAPGWYVMNPDGTNRRYLGTDSFKIKEEYSLLREQESLSPDGRCRVYTTEAHKDDEPQVYIQCQPDPGAVHDIYPTWKVSQGLARVSYDAVWAPDGHRIAFVSQTGGSDDIWVAYPDPEDPELWNYTKNPWEWDKHPSWSPDSRQIVFWSNREGTQQVFIIDENGRNLIKISNTPWDEYDPLWIKPYSPLE